MQDLYKNNKRWYRSKFVLLFIFIICLTIMLIYIFKYKNKYTKDINIDTYIAFILNKTDKCNIRLKNSLAYFIYPLLKFQNYIYVKVSYLASFKNYIDDISINYQKNTNLRKKINDLEQQNTILMSKLVKDKAIDNYMSETKDLYNYHGRYKTDHMALAQIVFKQINDDDQYFYIDAGKNRDISTDMVAVYKNFLVGRITQVYNNYSKVTLITSKDCKVAAYCSSSNSHGIHVGINKDLTKLLYISHLEDIKNEDMVISSGQGLVFPTGFGIGTIQKVEHKNLHYDITIKPLIDFKKIKYCYILSKGSKYKSNN